MTRVRRVALQIRGDSPRRATQSSRRTTAMRRRDDADDRETVATFRPAHRYNRPSRRGATKRPRQWCARARERGSSRAWIREEPRDLRSNSRDVKCWRNATRHVRSIRIELSAGTISSSRSWLLSLLLSVRKCSFRVKSTREIRTPNSFLNISCIVVSHRVIRSSTVILRLSFAVAFRQTTTYGERAFIISPIARWLNRIA